MLPYATLCGPCAGPAGSPDAITFCHMRSTEAVPLDTVLTALSQTADTRGTRVMQMGELLKAAEAEGKVMGQYLVKIPNPNPHGLGKEFATHGQSMTQYSSKYEVVTSGFETCFATHVPKTRALS